MKWGVPPGGPALLLLRSLFPLPGTPACSADTACQLPPALPGPVRKMSPWAFSFTQDSQLSCGHPRAGLQGLCTGSVALLSRSESNGSELALRGVEPSLSSLHLPFTWHLAPEGVLATRPDLHLPFFIPPTLPAPSFLPEPCPIQARPQSCCRGPSQLKLQARRPGQRSELGAKFFSFRGFPETKALTPKGWRRD